MDDETLLIIGAAAIAFFLLKEPLADAAHVVGQVTGAASDLTDAALSPVYVFMYPLEWFKSLGDPEAWLS